MDEVYKKQKKMTQEEINRHFFEGDLKKIMEERTRANNIMWVMILILFTTIFIGGLYLKVQMYKTMVNERATEKSATVIP